MLGGQGTNVTPNARSEVWYRGFNNAISHPVRHHVRKKEAYVRSYKKLHVRFSSAKDSILCSMQTQGP